jgi:hypothetical protein
MVVFSSAVEFVFINAILNIFCAVVAFAVSIFSYRALKITHEKNFLFFALGFFMLALGIIASSIGNIAYYLSIEQCFFSNTCSLWQKFFYIANFSFVALTLYALNLFIFVYSKAKARVLMVLAFIETSAIALLLFKTHWFHLIAALFLLFLIVLSTRTYFRKRNPNSLMIAIAFILLFLSQIFFSLTTQLFSYLGHTSQFLSFLFFFVMLLRIKYIKPKIKK